MHDGAANKERMDVVYLAVGRGGRSCWPPAHRRVTQHASPAHALETHRQTNGWWRHIYKQVNRNKQNAQKQAQHRPSKKKIPCRIFRRPANFFFDDFTSAGGSQITTSYVSFCSIIPATTVSTSAFLNLRSRKSVTHTHTCIQTKITHRIMSQSIQS